MSEIYREMPWFRVPVDVAMQIKGYSGANYSLSENVSSGSW